MTQGTFTFQQSWEKTLRKIVEICYEYHKQPFLLKYSRDLCENEPANLRYVKASDSTTSLYSRHPKKLLLTFRNENMVSPWFDIFGDICLRRFT